jgi:alkylation response protein AidB-like acyl-CoA dehydrogenase
MTQYVPPLRDMQFVMHEVLNATQQLNALPAHSEIDAETVNAVLEEAGKFAVGVLAPINQSGDREGCKLDPVTHEVTSPQGFKEAYAQYVEGGWPALSCDPNYGGQGLPMTVQQCINEMFNAANQGWSMYHGLTRGAYEALHAHGTPEQKRLYLPKLTSGKWTASMCMTEPHAGTDLGLLRTRAEPQGDGTYRITGAKIFISSGEHGMTENILHLVLARLPSAPPGSKGISLFAVPKFLLNEDGSRGERNPIFCGALEHKMGIRGSATCQMNIDGAIGTLVGEPHKGLNAMFVMMNAARLGVGTQGLGVSEAAYQNAAAYAKDRLQMRSMSGPKAPDKAADPIIVHPDVRRMLLTARAYTEGARALALHTALLIDTELSSTGENERRASADEIALLTPIVKAFLSDNAWISTSICLQVFGGHGYIAETGMEQYVRDVRIIPLYEGTNGIQALDLLGRKVLSDNAGRLTRFIGRVNQFVEQSEADVAMQEFTRPLTDLRNELLQLTAEIGGKARENPDEVGGAAVDYLRVCGHFVFAYFWARMAKVALAKQNSGDPFYTAKLATARFYYTRLLPETAGLLRTARAGVAALMTLDEALF